MTRFNIVSVLLGLILASVAVQGFEKKCKDGEAYYRPDNQCALCPEGSYEKFDRCFACRNPKKDTYVEGSTQCSDIDCLKIPEVALVLDVNFEHYGQAMKHMKIPNTDGTCRFRNDISKGAIDEVQLRHAPANYKEGTKGDLNDDGLPNPRLVSNTIFAQSGSMKDLNTNNTNLLLIYLGQFIDHDITLINENNYNDFANIKVPAGDFHFSDIGEIEFLRSRYVFDRKQVGPRRCREFMNRNTAWADMSNVYGNYNRRGEALRSFQNGELLTSTIHGNEYLPFESDEGEVYTIDHPDNCGAKCQAKLENPDNFFCGDVRCNENPVLSAFHTMFVREHNRIARWFKQAYNEDDDEIIFQNARIRNIILYQKIIWDYLTTLVGELNMENLMGPYVKMDRLCDPGMEIHFTTAAYRFGHSAIADQIAMANQDGEMDESKHMSLNEAFFTPKILIEKKFILNQLLNGALLMKHEPIDAKVVDALRNHLFQNMDKKLDLVALNIQRGRDHGLSSLNSWRKALREKMYMGYQDLPGIKNFQDLTDDAELIRDLTALYGSVDKVDPFVAGMAERKQTGSMLGVTFTHAIIEQFKRVRDCDPFWFENEWIKQIDGVGIETETLSDIFARNGGSTLFTPGANPFKVPNI
uniref:Uncharacterized protein n=2 Tax=Sar TaxID=2698737 RepID=A0A7S3LN59_9STRA|mmetsp:Transcript_9547/g.11885  ORF Transcript_9547/g.11885 Transcript_9547/m.11885 type:complete len:640 (+) Transcript_9547:17-1936(+)|eukprot:CAMPEP_0204860480 /NCGR_PEP_ID=MMETSP1348-20121228/423_1 /ASSEMBLY_ACC=CAM_ASM_000700 /TAXON_ID=215587 /ORGANISM="Aplanochytrium stocchinoi, Strain GSBS06" /LENGTH=639 /DNA_ID=CAMNT_0052009187 /DNA_START=152 /DNA_END=2071 /DNA_ORIENTATION=-